MPKKIVPSVRIWRMPDDPDKVCFASYHAKANQHKTKKIENRIAFVYEPLRPEQKERFRILRKAVLEQFEHQPIGGGVLVHIQTQAVKYFHRGQIYGVGKCLDLAAANGYGAQADARGKTYYGGTKVEDHGRMSIGDNSRFYWLEKAGKTEVREYKRKVWQQGLWMGDGSGVTAHVPNTSFGLCG